MNKATKSIIQSANKEPVLLVDDTADLVYPLQLFLNETGYQTDVALGAEAALKKIAHKVYKIIILYLVMPGMDGITCLQKIKES